MSLFHDDRILYFIIWKVFFPRASNFTQIMDNELFYMWAIKQFDFNFLYFILKFFFDHFIRNDIGYFPYAMILAPFF